MNSVKVISVVLIVSSLLIACEPVPTAMPQVMPSPVSVATALPTRTVPSTPIATSTPSPTVQVATPTAIIPPDAKQAEIAYAGSDGNIWLINEDGTGSKQVSATGKDCW